MAFGWGGSPVDYRDDDFDVIDDGGLGSNDVDDPYDLDDD